MWEKHAMCATGGCQGRAVGALINYCPMRRMTTWSRSSQLLLANGQLSTRPVYTVASKRNQPYIFYHAMLCIRGTSHGPVSVRHKMAKRRITQTTPHDSPGTLVFWRQRSLRNSTRVTLYGGTKCRWSGSKSATFDK